MLNLQSKLCKLVFAALVFSMVAFGVLAPAMAMAKEANAGGSTVNAPAEKASGEKNADKAGAKKAAPDNSGTTKTVTVDFSGRKEQAGIANRKVFIWKLTDDITGEKLGKALSIKGKDPLNEANPILDKMSAEELDKKFGPHMNKVSDAKAILEMDLSLGTYYVRVEEKQGEASVFPFVFTMDLQSNKMLIYPKLKVPSSSGVELLKISTDRVPLPGAVFQLFFLDKNNRIPVKNPSGGADFVTDDKGEIHVNDLAPGKYVFKEVKAPEGYRIKNPETSFDVTDKNRTTVTVENYKDKEGGKTFKKVSSTDGKPLSGAQFLVTKKTEKGYMRMKKGGKDMVLTSGTDGTFVADGLPDGDYYLWEIKAPEGYAPLSGSVKFIVSASSLKKELIIKNTPQERKPKEKIPKEKKPGGKTPYDDKHVKIPKTGDVQLLMMSVTGLLSGLLGVKILKDNE